MKPKHWLSSWVAQWWHAIKKKKKFPKLCDGSLLHSHRWRGRDFTHFTKCKHGQGITGLSVELFIWHTQTDRHTPNEASERQNKCGKKNPWIDFVGTSYIRLMTMEQWHPFLQKRGPRSVVSGGVNVKTRIVVSVQTVNQSPASLYVGVATFRMLWAFSSSRGRHLTSPVRSKSSPSKESTNCIWKRKNMRQCLESHQSDRNALLPPSPLMYTKCLNYDANVCLRFL